MATGSIFISYRRADTEGQSGRLFKDLRDHFGAERVLFDVVGMEKGRDFRRTLEERLDQSAVLLAVIGKSWLTVQDGEGQRRLDDPRDLVRLETATALRKNLAVLPVLVGGAAMPREAELPKPLKDLAYRDGVELTHARWDSDVRELITALEKLLGAPPRRRWGPWLGWGATLGAAGLGAWLGPLAWQALQATPGAAPGTGAAVLTAPARAASPDSRSVPLKPALPALSASSASSAPFAVASSVKPGIGVVASTSTTLRADSDARLDELFRRAQALPGWQLAAVEVEGHTDSLLGAAYGLKLSERRAEAVKARLVALGVDAQRIQTVGKGPSEPMGNNQTAEGRASNNRAKVSVTGSRAGDGALRLRVNLVETVWFK